MYLSDPSASDVGHPEHVCCARSPFQLVKYRDNSRYLRRGRAHSSLQVQSRPVEGVARAVDVAYTCELGSGCLPHSVHNHWIDRQPPCSVMQPNTSQHHSPFNVPWKPTLPAIISTALRRVTAFLKPHILVLRFHQPWWRMLQSLRARATAALR